MRTQVEIDQRVDWLSQQVYKLQERIAELEKHQQPVQAVARQAEYNVATKDPATGEML